MANIAEILGDRAITVMKRHEIFIGKVLVSHFPSQKILILEDTNSGPSPREKQKSKI